jgi:bacillolysin
MRRVPQFFFGAAFFCLFISAPWVIAASGDDEATQQALEGLRTAAPGTTVSIARSPATGVARFMSVRGGPGVPAAGRGPEERAAFFARTHGRAFGLPQGDDVRTTAVLDRDALGLDHVRVQQTHLGVPVTGAELMVHLRGSYVVAANGRTLPEAEKVGAVPTLDAAQAVEKARRVLAKHLGVTDAAFEAPRLEIVDVGFLGGPPRPAQLAWFVEARKLDLRQYIWIDALRGAVVLRFSQLPDLKKRAVYDAHSRSALPGSLVRSEGGAETGDADADGAYDYAGDTWDYYSEEHGRDSFDGKGGTIKSTVHYCPSPDPTTCPFANAFWNGTQMVYGDGFASADDVDAHELTHAVTERTAHLFYYMQSGALNESFSDIFGETVDQGNSKGNDSDAAKWMIGEDLPGGAIRDMMVPTASTPVACPGKMSDAEFFCPENALDQGADAGGVHINSGVPNHAYALLVDGGTYNGKTVTGIGLKKAGKIQYRALTTYLLSASDFLDDYNALQQSCQDLVGTAGITAGDCAQVKNALDAVQMSAPWPCLPLQATTPAFCPVGQGPVDVFADNLEKTASGNWTTSALVTGNAWTGGVGAPNVYFDLFATSGTHHFWGFDYDVISDSTVNTAHPVTIPPGARMQFQHSYGMDTFAGTFFDGGVIEYSTNNGASWQDAGPLISAGAGYGGPISSTFGNPLGDRNGFVSQSWGYTATQLNLATLAGQNARFRFRLGTDDGVADYGWFIDDVRIYTCGIGGTLHVSSPTYTVGEAGPSVTVTVTRTGGLADGVTVHYATVNGSAQAGLDYGAVSGTLTFGSGVTSRTVTIPILNDTLDEGDETFDFVLSAPAGPTVTLGAPAAATVTITDNDTAGTVQFGAAAYSVAESAASATITVTRTGGSAAGATVHYATSNGTAASPADYTPANGTLTFAAGVMSQTFKVFVTPDDIDEANETINLTLSAPGGGATLGARSTATLTITDNDVAGAIQFGAAAYAVSEGAGTALVNVVRSGGAAGGVTVHYATADGTATAPADYTAQNGTLTFGPGVMSQSFAIPIVNDTKGENDETVRLTLSSPTGGAVLGLRPTATLTIRENETVLQFSAPQFSAKEGVPTATITVKRSGVTTTTASVDYTTANGTALADSDYTTVSGRLTFTPGIVTKTFSVPILNPNATAEAPEFALLKLSGPIGGVLGPQDTATLMIADDDPVVSFGAAAYTASEGGAAPVITVKRSGSLTPEVTVHYAATNGTATGADYGPASGTGTLTFPAGVAVRTFTVPILQDTLAEPTETVNLTLSAPTGARLGLAAAVLSIKDDEPVVSFTMPNYNIGELGGTATIVVKRAGGSAMEGFSVNYATSNGTAVAGADYDETHGTLSFAPGVVNRTFTVTSRLDTTPEAGETVVLSLTGAVGAQIGLGTATLTILDNDPSISFAAAAYTVAEQGTATITVKRTGVLTAPATVNYATGGGTATAGLDYVATAGTLTFAAGVAMKSFTVPILADAQDETNETVNLTLSGATGGAIGQGTAVLTITDNDLGSVVEFAAAGFGGNEPSLGAVISVKRTGNTASTVTVNYATSAGTATAGSDYTTTAGTLTFSPGETVKTFTVPIANDAPEPAETVNLTLSAPSGGAALGAQSTAVLLIVGNE